MSGDPFLLAIRAQIAQILIISVLDVTASEVRSPAWKQPLNYPFTEGSSVAHLTCPDLMLSSL